MSELNTFSTKMHLPETNIEDCILEVERIHNKIRMIEVDREKVIEKFSTLREILSPKINIL